MRGRHARASRVELSQRAAVVTLLTLTVAAAAGVGVLVATEPTSRPRTTFSWAVGTPLIVADLPVARCPTNSGAPSSRAVDLPTHVRAEVSRALAPELSVFADDLDTLTVVAPTTWGCTALDGVAGSSSLIVYPPGSPRPAWGRVTAVRRGIVVSQTGSCTGCSLEVACALFPAARAQYLAAYRVGCRGVASRREQRVMVSAHRLLFIDPPGILGAGRPSGGAYAAYGAMLWHLRGSRDGTAWLDTCTLPTLDRELCVQSVRAFLARHPG